MFKIDKIDNDYFFRGDLYKPFGENTITGLKILQAQRIITSNLNKIKNDCNNTVVCHSSVHGVTGAVLSKVCRDNGIKCIVCIGGGNDNTVNIHPTMKLIELYGGQIINMCKHGMFSAIKFRIEKLCSDNKYFNGCFTSNYQSLKNVFVDYDFGCKFPDDIDNIFIPTGSGISFAGIYDKLKSEKVNYKNLYACCVGPDRRNDINKFLIDSFNPQYTTVEVNTELVSTYSKKIKCSCSIPLDDIYENKMYSWYKNKRMTNNETNLFFIIGKNPSINDIKLLTNDKNML